ncbi:hypothetical protein XENOCAPTIV_026610, partial [Xenoophorus captivus]
NSANSLNFQIYLLEGLHRWNHNRATAAVETETSGLRSYSGELVHSVNTDYERVFGKKLVPSFTPPAKYTGIQYCMFYAHCPVFNSLLFSFFCNPKLVVHFQVN